MMSSTVRSSRRSESTSAITLRAVRSRWSADDAATHSADAVDYAGFAHQVAQRVAQGANARGILLCGTGLGMGYAANRHPGVRAAVVWSPEVAHLAREHNDANVLVLPARCLDDETGVAILKEWLDTPFAGGRHARRVAQIEETGPNA